jgi:hypothetical protein
MHTHPYEYTYANHTPMSTFVGLNTGRSRNSQSHQWRLVVDGNVAYHLKHNAEKSRKKYEHQDLNRPYVKIRAPGFEPTVRQDKSTRI